MYAWDALRRRPARTAATSLGIGLATALVVTLLSVSEGVQSSAVELASNSGIDLIVTSANTSLAGGAFPQIPGAHALADELPRADPNVETASPWLVASLTFANSSLYAAANASSVPASWSPTSAGEVGWIPGESAGLEMPSILAGPGYPTLSDPHYANGTYDGPATHAIVLDEGLAAVLHVAPGDLVYASAATPSGPALLGSWFASATPYRVVGVSNPYWLVPSTLLAFGYLSEVQTLLAGGGPPQDGASLVLIHLFDPSNAAADQRRLEQAYPTLSVFTLGDILTEIQQSVALYRSFGTLVGLIGLAVAALFATTVLLMSVDDRSRELALLRAIGYPRSAIVRFVVSEGLLLAGLGLVAGLALGYLGALGMDRLLERLISGLPAGFSFVRFDTTVIVESALGVIAVGLAASALPAVRALGIPVAQELRAP